MALLHGLHAQVFPRLNLPCFSDVLWRATVGRCARKSAACAELWGLIFLCRVKVHTVRVFQWPSWRALASQNLLGSGFLSRHTGPYWLGPALGGSDLTFSLVLRQIRLTVPATRPSVRVLVADRQQYREHDMLPVLLQSARGSDKAFEQAMFRKSARLQQRRQAGG